MRAVLAATITIATAIVAASARADGLPVLGVDVGASGVTVSGSPYRWITIDEGQTTLVERVARNGGSVLRWTRLRGTFTIPAVAYDRSASGVSADGSRLVLIEPRQSFPRVTTRFTVLDATGLGVYRTITLRGDFSFDAVSPRGRTMYLVNYRSANPNEYHVRAYDLTSFRLLPKAITDPAEHEDAMHGAPINRLMSADGRWAYTLYDGAGAASPFVHALDTASQRAHCIDLPMLTGRRDLWELRLRPDAPSGLRVVSAAGTVASIDTTTFTAGPPATPSSTDIRPWLLYGAAALVAALLGTVAGRLARRRPATA